MIKKNSNKGGIYHLNDQTIRLGNIGQIALPVRDIQKSIRFYRDLLGMTLLFQFPNMAFFDCGGIRLMLSLPESEMYQNPGSVIYFKTEDIEEAFRQLSEKGVLFLDKPHRIADMGDHEIWMTFFRDPDQNPLALMSEVFRKQNP
jgi:catechol 2,3-dioxygenase-like lactoylglutathione lyase family enzyme